MSDKQTIQYYDQNATDYAKASETSALRDAAAEFSRELRAGASVLDLGCGAGRDLVEFRRFGLLAVGLDASHALGSLAAKASGCPVVLGDMLTLPFVEQSFDGVWASASILHATREEVPAILQEVARVLRDGGAFFCSLKVGDGDWRDERGRRFTYFRFLEWQAQLIGAGFTDIRRLPERYSEGGSKWLRTLSVLPPA